MTSILTYVTKGPVW